MPSKLQLYSQLADHAAGQITGSYQEWTAFLTTAARLYKYPYNEQLMIYAQRPEATACAEYDFWHKRMGRYVRRGSRGIAIIDSSGETPRLRYVFDVADTGDREQSRRPYLWQLQPEHEGIVSAALEQRFGVSGENGLGDQLERVAAQLANEYWNDHRSDILAIVDGSFLEEYDEFNIGAAFRNAAAVSITYSLLSRCGMEPEQYFEHEDFLSIFDWNTPDAVAALGSAVSEVNQTVLRQIEVTIKKYEREKLAERSATHGEQSHLYPERGLSDPRPEAHGTTGDAPRQVREDAAEIPERAPAHPVEPADSVREAVPAPAGDRRDGPEAAGTDDAGAGAGGRGDGGSESPRPDEMGGPDEQLQGAGRGDHSQRAGVQLTDQPEPEQRQDAKEAESVQTPSASSVSRTQTAFAASYQEYNDVKRGCPSDMVLYQVGDFFELYGEDAKAAAPLLDLTLTTRPVPGAGRVEMCGLPSHRLEQYVERLREKYDVTISAVPEGDAERRVFRLLSTGHEAERAAAPEAAGEKSAPPAAPYQLTQADIDEALQSWNGDADSKRRVVEHMRSHARDKDTAMWLSREYGGDPELPLRFTVTGTNAEAVWPWTKVQRRIAQLIREDRFLTAEEQEVSAPAPQPAKADVDLASRGDMPETYTTQNGVTYHPGDAIDSHTGDEDPIIRLVIDHVDEQHVWYTVPDKPDEGMREMSRLLFETYLNTGVFQHAPAPEIEKEAGLGPSPTVRELYEHYKPAVIDLVLADEPYRNACRNSDKENALLEGAEAIKRAALQINDPQFMRLYYDLTSFHNNLHREVLDETYPMLAEAPQAEAPEMADTGPVQLGPRDPMASAYGVGDFVFLEDTEYRITDLSYGRVELLDPTLAYPVYRTETRENFERALRRDIRNGPITEYLPANLEQYDQDLREVLTSGLLSDRDKGYISGWLRSGEGNTKIAQRLSERFAGTVDTMQLVTGETADFRASTTGMEVEILRPDEAVLATLYAQWVDYAAVLRALYQQELDGLSHEPVLSMASLEGQPVYQVGDKVVLPLRDREIHGTVAYVGDTEVRIDTGPYSWSHETLSREQFEEALRRDERNAGLFHAPEHTGPAVTTEPVAVYPAEGNRLPYDVVIQTLRVDEPKQEPPEQSPPEDFRIMDDNLGAGGPKEKFWRNAKAIAVLKQIEQEGRYATPEEQHILSQYVGWGGLSDAFDPDKPAWAAEYSELKSLLTDEEYNAARASTLNAHYTSPAVIKAIYEAVANMGFQSGNILEPAMGVGNFFGCLPEAMRGSRLYGVELDSITGRIAKQLYPKADITVAGFETTDRRSFFDLAVGNVPFGNYKVFDKDYNKLGFSIHDYFFAKTLDQLRPGGIIAFVTSRYTMDKRSPEVRRYIAQRADLLGAIRLPNNAFKANANTEVTSDILFFQKRDRPLDIVPEWVYLGETADGIPINRYFASHPEMVLGTMQYDDRMYGDKDDVTCQPIPGADLAAQLHEAVQHIRGEYVEAELPELGEGEKIDASIPADPDVQNYSYAVVDGEVYFRENSIMVKRELNATAKERIKGMVELRDCTRRLIDLQMWESDPLDIRAEQQRLNQLYDRFTAKFGLINSKANSLAFSDDSAYYLLCSLEMLDEEGNLERKADMFTKRTIKQAQVVTSVDTASEALAVSIAEKARVDIPYMVQFSGKTEEELTSELQGVIYRDFGDLEPERIPKAFFDITKFPYVTADEYLSGDVRRKLKLAEYIAAFLPEEQARTIQPNIDALRAVQPKDLEASEIDVRLGAAWIGKAYIQQFMEELLEPPYYLRRILKANYADFTAEWNIAGKGRVSSTDVAACTTYGTQRANAYEILEDTLNLRDVRIYDTIEDASGHKRRVLNSKETTLAQQKQQAIKDAFRDWIWRDPDRRQHLVRKYNDIYNSIRPREYDGQHITFSGMNPEITLRPHQLNAIAHILYGDNVLLAHEVGAGKTFEMVAAAMESKRLGLCRKSLFAVPNHLTEQWAAEFLRLYPAANILVATKKDFEKQNRKKFCARIATGDYDAIILGHSQFERIPISAERQERLLQEQIREVEEGLRELKRSGVAQFTIKQMEKTKRNLEARLDRLNDTSRKDDVVTFEQLGVDRLFVDEAHSYKNLFLYTKMRNVAGLSTTDAQKSSDMLMKCRYMDEITGGKGIVFATGTPVSNSMTEIYTMMRYLQHDLLQRRGWAHFDCWAAQFGETVTAIELAPEGTGYRARTRFARFSNLPELMSHFREAADIKTADQLDLPRPEAVYHNEVAHPTEQQREMVKQLSERAAEVHAGKVAPTEDNMLKITSDGRKLGLDQRIINPMLPDDPASKVNLCVDNIVRIWQDGQPEKLTQIVFCDISTPKARAAAQERKAAKAAGGRTQLGTELHALDAVMQDDPEPPFSVYEDVKEKLVARGIPAEQIAFIHDANTEVKKKELFAKVRSGLVRVLMGSTFKMGAGMNVQDRLIALHDLDCPWRPGDLEQRSGRIIRQGNLNPKVHIYRYVTEATFDSYLWQTVENKQKFISQIMTSKSPVRSCEDIDETALSYAEIKALCAGDPRIKEKMDLDIDVARLRLLKADHQAQQYRLEDNLLQYFPKQIEQNRGFIAGLKADLETLAAHPHPEDGFAGMVIKGDTLTDKDNAGAAILEACKEVKGLEPMEIGSYRGFSMHLSIEHFGEFVLTLRGKMTYKTDLGRDARGNLTRIDNTLASMPERLQAVEAQLENLHKQVAAAKAELGKPYPQEAELQQKSERLAELNALLDMEGGNSAPAQENIIAKGTRPSVLEGLKRSVPMRETTRKTKQHEEVR